MKEKNTYSPFQRRERTGSTFAEDTAPELAR